MSTQEDRRWIAQAPEGLELQLRERKPWGAAGLVLKYLEKNLTISPLRGTIFIVQLIEGVL